MAILVVAAAAAFALGAAQPAAHAGQTTPEPTPTEAGETLTGTIRGEEGPVADATVIVRRDGRQVAETSTGSDGTWQVPLEAPGSYTVELVESSLPEGIALREGANNPLSVRVLGGSTRTVVFPIGAGAAAGGGLLRLLAERGLNGLQLGLIVAMASVGLSLVFGTTHLINFAHGELVSAGAILAWFLSVPGELPLVVAGLLSAVALGVLGGGLELGVFRPLRRRSVGTFQLLVITIGLTLLLQNLLLLVFGGLPRPYDQYIGQDQLNLGPVGLTPRELGVMVLATLILTAVGLTIQHTRIGRAMRAVADNRDLAESSGIDVDRVILIVWISGAGLAAVGGVLYGLTIQVDFFMGFRLLLLMFAGVILGGLGTAYGAIAGGLVVGLATELSTVWFPVELKLAWGLLILIVVLLIRPQGILGRRSRIG